MSSTLPILQYQQDEPYPPEQELKMLLCSNPSCVFLEPD
jgi:hypothetical protein